MVNATKKLIHFLKYYTNNNINYKMKDFILKNNDAIKDLANDTTERVIRFDKSKINKEEYDKAILIEKELGEINQITNSLYRTEKVFCDFPLLSKYLKLSKLNVKECFEVIMSLVESNIQFLKRLNDETFEIYTSYLMYSYEKYINLTPQEKSKIEEYKEWLNIFLLSKEESKKKMYVITKMQKTVIDNPNEFIEANNIIKTYYLDKKEIFGAEDINKIIESLLKIGLDEQLVNSIKVILEKELSKRNKKIEKSEVKTEVQNVQKKSNVITDKEYKAIKKELRSYFDFYNVKKVKELNSNEIIRCIELLIKTDSPIEEIKRFIRIFEKKRNDYEKDIGISLENKNIISIYVELYNKLKFYEKKLGMEENLNYINDCLQEMFMCSVEDYSFYKNEIEVELRKILVLLPQTYEYEIKETEKRIKFEI